MANLSTPFTHVALCNAFATNNIICASCLVPRRARAGRESHGSTAVINKVHRRCCCAMSQPYPHKCSSHNAYFRVSCAASATGFGKMLLRPLKHREEEAVDLASLRAGGNASTFNADAHCPTCRKQVPFTEGEGRNAPSTRKNCPPQRMCENRYCTVALWRRSGCCCCCCCFLVVVFSSRYQSRSAPSLRSCSVFRALAQSA